MAVHYRQARERNSTRRAVLSAARSAQGRATRWWEAGRQLPRAGRAAQGPGPGARALTLRVRHGYLSWEMTTPTRTCSRSIDRVNCCQSESDESRHRRRRTTSAIKRKSTGSLKHSSPCVEAIVADISSGSGLTPSGLPVGDAIDFLRLSVGRRPRASAPIQVHGGDAWHHRPSAPGDSDHRPVSEYPRGATG